MNAPRITPLLRGAALAAAAMFSSASPSISADIAWSGPLTGTNIWNTGANWVGGNFPNSVDDRADLRNDWVTPSVINLNAPVTINGVISDDTGTNAGTAVVISNSGTVANTLTLAGPDPSIAALDGSSLSIGASLQGDAGFVKTGDGFLLLAGSNSLAGNLVISEGVLAANNTNALNSGTTIRVDPAAAFRVNRDVKVAGLTDNAGSGGLVTNTSGGGKTLNISGTGTYSFAGRFSGSTATTTVGLRVSGAAVTQILAGDNTGNKGYQSVTTSGGTLVFAKQNSIFQGLLAGAVVNSNSPANPGINVTGGGTVALGVGDAAGGYFDAAAIAVFLDSDHMGASSNEGGGFRNGSFLGFDTGNATGGTFTYSDALTDIGLSTFNGFAKLGAGTLVLDGDSYYTGNTQVRQGTLQIGAGGPAGTITGGIITVSSGATLAFNRSDEVTRGNRVTGAGGVAQLGTGATTLSSTLSDYSGGTVISAGRLTAASLGSGTVTIGGTANQLTLNQSTTFSNVVEIAAASGLVSQGLINAGAGINAVLSGPINITAVPTQGGHFASSDTGTITVSGPITSSVDVWFRRGMGIFSGGGSYTNLRVRGGTMKVGAENGLATSTAVALGGDGPAVLDLNGFNQSLQGLAKGAATATVLNNGAAEATLTTTGTSSYAGVIQDGAAKVSLAVNGGSLTLSGTNTYTGNTTVTDGSLAVAAGGALTFVIGPGGANNALLGSGTAQIDGRFDFDLAGASTNAGASWTIVANGVNESYGATFFVNGFNGSGGRWTNTTNGVSYVFSQSDSVLTVQAAAADNYGSWAGYWQTVYPAFTGPEAAGAADPDGDGFNNNMEFAFDGNPLVGTPALLAAVQSGTNAVFTYAARKNPPGGVVYEVQSTTDLATGLWTNAAVTISNSANTNGLNLPADYERKEFQRVLSGKEFYRVKATLAP